MRPVHYILAAIIALVVAVASLETRPVASNFDPKLHGPFKAKWIKMHNDLGTADQVEAAFVENWNKRTHIVYWEKWASFEGEACQKMVDAFNLSQEDIYCHRLQTSQVDRKTLLAIVGGSPPDVAGLWTHNVAPFGEADAIMPLDALMADPDTRLTENHYVPNYLRLCQYDGKTVALPSTPATTALFYNKKHFANKKDELIAAGLDTDLDGRDFAKRPLTFDELDRYAEILSEFNDDGTPEIMGFLPTEPGWFHASWVYYFGGKLMDDETGEITTDLAENIRAFEWIKGYANRYGRTNLTRFQRGFGNYDSPQNAFIDEKVSMVLHGVYFPAFIDRHKPHLDYGVVPFACAPGVPGPRSVMKEDVLMIPRGCPHPKAAWKFVYYVQTEGLPIICRLQGKHLPIRLPPDQADQFARTHPNPHFKVFNDLALSEHSFIVPRTIVWQEYNAEIWKMFDHIWHWKVPEDKLAGLTGDARAKRVKELCRQEIVKTLRDVRKRMTRLLKQKQDRVRMRAERAGR